MALPILPTALEIRALLALQRRREGRVNTRYTARLIVKGEPTIILETAPRLAYADWKPWDGGWCQVSRRRAAQVLRVMREGAARGLCGPITRERIGQ